VRYEGDDEPTEGASEDSWPSVDPPGRPTPGADGLDAHAAARKLEALREKLTQTGTLMGTLGYMAPEQARGGHADARSDQFAFCVSLYEALFGQRPFSAAPMRELLKMAFGQPVSPLPPPAGSRVPRWLVRALWRGLSARPADRWSSMDALLVELGRHGTRTWARWLSWPLALAGVGWALASGSTDEREPACDRAGDAIAAAWGDEPRERVRNALLATALPHAEETWTKLEPKLDAYARALATAEVAACERRDTGPRRGCLDARSRALRRTVALLEGADVHVVDGAAELVAELPPVERCEEPEAALEREPSRTPEQQHAVDRLREQLELARALARTGKPEEALRELAPVPGEAVALDDPAFLAEVRMAEGFILLQDGRLEPAEQRLRQAFQGALGQGSGKVALEAATSLAYLVGVQQANSEAGLWLGATADALADRHDPGGRLEAEAVTVIAQLLAVRGEHAEAEERYHDALEILTSLVGDDDLALVVPLNGLGQALKNQQQLDQAQELYERALEIRIDELGEHHHRTAYQRISLGTVLMERAELVGAEAQYDRALEVLDALPPRRELLGELHANRGVLRSKQERHEEGAQELRLAIEHWEAIHGADHPLVATGRLNLGINLLRRDRYEPAAEQFERALRIMEHAEPTPANVEIHCTLLLGLADTRKAQGRHGEAESSLRRALELLAHSGKAGGLEAAKLHNRFGALAFASGRFDDAVREREAALAILEAMPAPDLRTAAQTLFHAAQALRAAGRHAQALDRAERAFELGLGEEGFEADRLADYARLRAELRGNTDARVGPR
jgi:tetratricopeptide (TPR) repeat protein